MLSEEGPPKAQVPHASNWTQSHASSWTAGQGAKELCFCQDTAKTPLAQVAPVISHLIGLSPPSCIRPLAVHTTHLVLLTSWGWSQGWDTSHQNVRSCDSWGHPERGWQGGAHWAGHREGSRKGLRCNQINGKAGGPPCNAWGLCIPWASSTHHRWFIHSPQCLFQSHVMWTITGEAVLPACTCGSGRSGRGAACGGDRVSSWHVMGNCAPLCGPAQNH